MREKFWELPLESLSPDEWEALCDGCAKCCLHKLEDEDTGDIFYTRVACHALDTNTCTCTRYDQRKKVVPDCVVINEVDREHYRWFPVTCSYRMRAEGKPLPQWHYLLTGSKETIHEMGMSVRGRVIPEENVHPREMQEQIVHWEDL